MFATLMWKKKDKPGWGSKECKTQEEFDRLFVRARKAGWKEEEVRGELYIPPLSPEEQKRERLKEMEAIMEKERQCKRKRKSRQR